MIHHVFRALSQISKHTTKTAARKGSMVIGTTVKPHTRASTIVKYWNK